MFHRSELDIKCVKTEIPQVKMKSFYSEILALGTETMIQESSLEIQNKS